MDSKCGYILSEEAVEFLLSDGVQLDVRAEAFRAIVDPEAPLPDDVCLRMLIGMFRAFTQTARSAHTRKLETDRIRQAKWREQKRQQTETSPRPDMCLVDDSSLPVTPCHDESRSVTPYNNKDNDNNNNKEKDKNIIESLFDRFWLAYPKKCGKEKAFEQFAAIYARGIDMEEVITAAQSQAEKGLLSQKYSPIPVRWLEEHRWQDGECRLTSRLRHLARNYREACRNGDDVQKLAIKRIAQKDEIRWKDIEDEILRQREEEG